MAAPETELGVDGFLPFAPDLKGSPCQRVLICSHAPFAISVPMAVEDAVDGLEFAVKDVWLLRWDPPHIDHLLQYSIAFIA